jgi:lipopolysaccharide transport system permease protein
MVVFTVIFSKLAKLPSDGHAPYPIMVYAAMLPWQFFSSSVSEASNSLITNTQLITKVYFPRIIIPISSVVTSFVDSLISFVILIFLMMFYKFTPSWNILLLPVFLLISFFTASGIGLYITALNVKYRDFRYIVPFIVQFGLYISPVGFSSSIVPEKYRLLYSLNPMVGVIDGFRWAILGGESMVYWPGFVLSIGVTIFFLFLGIYQFRKMEKKFADII